MAGIVHHITPHHEQILAKAGIPRQAALDWGIWSSSTPDGLDGTDIDSEHNKGLTGLVFPLNRALGGGRYAVTYQMRIDDHLVDEESGQRKYAQASGVGAVINVPAMMVERVGNVRKFLVVEGTKQTIAASLYAPDDVLVIGIQGARNWSKDGIALPVLNELVPMGDDVEVFLGFDADWQTNPDVWAAAQYLSGHFKTGRGANVKLLVVPGGKKVGLDDFLGTDPDPVARPRMLANLMADAVANLGRRPARKRVAGGHSTVPTVTIAPDDRLVPATELGAMGATVQDLLEDFKGDRMSLPGGVMVVVGGDTHGVWVARPGLGEGAGPVLEQIADWWAWRSASTRKLRIAADGTAVPVDGVPATWTVEIVRADGRRWQVHGLTDTESTDPARVVDAAGAAVAIPAVPAHRVALANMLRVFGEGAGRKQVDELVSTGWIVDPELGPVWAAPAGSVCSAGITHAITVGPPLGSEDGSMNDAMSQLGWDRVAEGEELRRGARAFGALIAMAPKRPEAGVALIGAQAAAPLRMVRRAAVLLQALPEVGKGHLLGAANWFWTPLGPKEFTVDMPDSSRAVATALAAWARDGVVFADDFKLVGTDKDVEVMQAFGVLARGSYSGASAAKATREGGLRRRTATATTALISGEEIHSDAATMQRVVTIELVAGDVDRTLGGPIEEFATEYGRTGLARAVWASYLQWLARYAAQHDDPLGALSELGAQARAEALKSLDGTSRADETVAVILAGWYLLTEWAEDVGVADLLPAFGVDEEGPLSAAIGALRDRGLAQHADNDPAQRVLSQVTQMIGAGRVSVENCEGYAPPVLDRTALGWRRDDERNGVWRGAVTHRIRLSKDEQWVVLPPSVVTAAVREAGQAIAPAKLAEAMTAAGYVGGRGERCPASLGIDSRPRGWVVPAAKVGIDELALRPEPPSKDKL